EESKAEAAKLLASSTSLDRYVALAGLILWASTKKEEELESGISGLLQNAVDPDEMFQKLDELFTDIQHDTYPAEPQIWQVSLNRKATAAIEKSVPAVKGDAARSVFRVKCDGIAWAVIDSGIDGDHPALRDSKRRPRVVKHFDFSDIRRIVSLDNARIEPGEPWLVEFLKDRKLDPAQAAADLRSLADDANNDRPIHWELVEKFITIEGATPPHSGHGTHVAGIIGASAAAMTPSLPAAAPGSPEEDDSQPRFADGMCPDIRFYDFRVLSKSLEDTEFAIIAALQYIRYLNERHSYITIHGANLSLSIPHDVRNFACGRTPVCNECERLVDSGVTVVAAAGNLGYHSFETKEGSYEGYSAYSITDPGNADGVITVGATHRFWPHTYGVSFFSSRGPTGDGRMKPDLVAPGERIRSCLPEGEWGELDGTSMAAPHVSGAAAMLMARYSELIAQPREIKRILCESATDLGRERNFQGHGMLDVLRAFQKV
ncbi:MAG TPA: S8 family peptidase, partial [Burkholderiales bacterium]|nr:S8 family peptidase [Burkholderiales bacterium]